VSFELRRYAGALRIAVARSGGHPSRPWLLALLTLGFPALTSTVRLARLLDHIVAPGWKTQQIRAPLFVVGHSRSGTTFVQSLLALDESRFFTARTWQLLLPAVSLQRLVGWGGRIDTRLGGRAERALLSLEDRIFGGVQEVHPSGWTAVEEDEALLLHLFATPRFVHFIPSPEIFEDLWIPDGLAIGTARRRLAWYRSCVQRLIYAHAPDATLLSKNPPFSGWLSTLNDGFPDARYLLMERPPEEAIPSQLELYFGAWRRVSKDLRRDGPELRALFRTSCALYRHIDATWPTLPADRRVRVAYKDLVADPEAAVRGVYEQFGWPVSQEFGARLGGAAEAARRRLPRARPPLLRHFGLREADLARELAPTG
jgi:omega-hydroxy-beta-dihydromenaquinone-9 sulfotransferase